MALGPLVIVGVGPRIGFDVVRTFAEAGHPVAMLARDKPKLDTYAAELASTGQQIRGYKADAADPDDLRAAIGAAIADLGAPEVLLYNIAVQEEDSPIGGDDQVWATNMALNALGARVAANAVLPELRDGRGTLLFAGGGYAVRPTKKFSSLSVGKAALRAYVQVLHDQLAGTGVHATCVTISKTLGSGEPRYEPAALAQAYFDLSRQPESDWQAELVY
jgi:NAD(P)-dependent dehydrogenase (short-subunit alcohol dehydrogenase family)